MTLFPIDPAAQAILKSLETQPELWVDSHRYLCLGAYHDAASLKLWKSPDIGLISIEKPPVTISRRSKRTLWAAYLRWEAGRKDTAEKRARAELMAALGEEP